MEDQESQCINHCFDDVTQVQSNYEIGKPKNSTSNGDDESFDGILYGDFETQIGGGEEADLHLHLKGCRKNPGHAKFIPIEAFTLEHLPQSQQFNDIYELIKAVADLTVRISVSVVSPDRPQFWPNTNIPYLFFNKRGMNLNSTGTGKVSFVSRFTDRVNAFGHEHWNGHTTCWCNSCKVSDTPSNAWWEFDVNTAAHVVFDGVESSHAVLRLFYDGTDSPKVVLESVNFTSSDIEGDRCTLKCVTCDNELGDKLYHMYKRFDRLFWLVRTRYHKTRDVDRLIFIVSHPHGCSKQVSFGQWKEKEQVGNVDYCKFTYDTCTCPGSSGATVFCVGYSASWLKPHVHSGSLSFVLNCSGVGWLS